MVDVGHRRSALQAADRDGQDRPGRRSLPPAVDDFWDQIKENMLNEFKEERFAQGLTTGISMTGKALRKFFPYQSDDVNELPDDISFGSK